MKIDYIKTVIKKERFLFITHHKMKGKNKARNYAIIALIAYGMYTTTQVELITAYRGLFVAGAVCILTAIIADLIKRFYILKNNQNEKNR